MSPTPTPALQTPQQKAILGTVVVFVLLLLFAFVGFWYGKQGTAKTENSTTNTTKTTTDTTTVAAAGDLSLPAKVTKILDNGLEVQTGTGETARTVVANVTSSTILRKLDFRSTKTSTGGGVPVKLTDFKTGNSVVVVSDNISGSTVSASKIIVFIYP